MHQEAPYLDGRAAAEFYERRPLRKGRGNRRTLRVEDAEFGSRRIIFRLAGDCLEQVRTGSIVEVLRREELLGCRQAGEDIVEELPFGVEGRDRRRIREDGIDGQGISPDTRQVEGSSQMRVSDRRRPVNCQR